MADAAPPPPDPAPTGSRTPTRMDATGPDPESAWGAGGPGAGVPHRIGHYHVVRAIATGGMGTVYEAIQDQPRRTVALKLMRQGLRAPAARRRFEYEAQVLARLRHPGIAQVYEAGTHHATGPGGVEEDVPYFAMEFVPDARTLTEHAQVRRLSMGARLELLAEVCDAAHHGHQKGIVHRDLKPGNILVDSSGRPKIIDFGVARAVDADLARATVQTAPGELVGTLQYMSPEQLEADPRELDARSDVYALGVVLFELLTGRLPHDLTGVTPAQAPAFVREHTPLRPSSIDPALRGDTETVILRALHKDRDRRYASAADLADDIRRLLASQPIAARRDSAAYILRTRARSSALRHPVGASLFAAGAGFLAGLWPGPSAVFRWTSFGAWFERTVIALAAPPGAPRLEHVRVVAMTDATDGEELARAAGVEGVANTQMATWRPLHGRLMERLAGAGIRARVVVWDSLFRVEGHDEGFAAGVQALRGAGVDTVVGAAWALGPDEAPDIRPALRAAGVRWGGVTFVGDADVAWKLDAVAQRRTQVPMPSLALEAFSATLHPGANAEYFLRAGPGTVEVRFDRAPGNPPAPRLIPLGQFTTLSSGFASPGLQPGDVVGGLVLRMPGDEALRSATIPYEELFTLDGAALRDRLDGKAILIANFRRGAHNPDEHPYPGGRRIRPPFAHAVGLDSLLGGPVIRLPRPLHIAILVGVGSLVGMAGAWLTGGRLAPMALAGAGLTGLATVLSLFAFRQASYLCNPAVPLLSMLIAAALAAWIVRVRRAGLLRRA